MCVVLLYSGFLLSVQNFGIFVLFSAQNEYFSTQIVIYAEVWCMCVRKQTKI